MSVLFRRLGLGGEVTRLRWVALGWDGMKLDTWNLKMVFGIPGQGGVNGI